MVGARICLGKAERRNGWECCPLLGAPASSERNSANIPNTKAMLFPTQNGLGMSVFQEIQEKGVVGDPLCFVFGFV